MCVTRMMSLLRIYNLCASENAAAEIRTQVLWGPQVYLDTTQKLAQLPFDASEMNEPRRSTGPELYQDVHITLRSEVIPEDRPEE